MPDCNTCEFYDRNSEQHEKIYSRLTALETQGGITNTQFSQIMDTLRELKLEVKEFKEKPSKRLDVIINAALQWVVVAFLAATVILK